VRSLAPNVHLVAAAREEENVKLLYGAGANLVVTPSVSGGRLMASVVKQHAVPHFLEDLLSFGEGLEMHERVVHQDEAGRLAFDLPDLRGSLILGVARGTERCPFHRLQNFPLLVGDVIVYLAGDPECTDDVALP
jgi:voltage-gated potassium channel